MSKRGPYNQHIYKSAKIPLRTYYRKKKRGIYEWNLGFFRNSNLNQTIGNSNPNQTIELTNESNNIIEQNQSLAHSDSNYSNTAYDSQKEDDVDYPDFQTLLSSENELTLETKCAILLTAFYSGRMPQSCFKTFLNAVNCFQQTDTPTTFDGVANVLLRHENQAISSKKSFFCVRCKEFRNTNNRFERNCSSCEER